MGRANEGSWAKLCACVALAMVVAGCAPQSDAPERATEGVAALGATPSLEGGFIAAQHTTVTDFAATRASWGVLVAARGADGYLYQASEGGSFQRVVPQTRIVGAPTLATTADRVTHLFYVRADAQLVEQVVGGPWTSQFGPPLLHGGGFSAPAAVSFDDGAFALAATAAGGQAAVYASATGNWTTLAPLPTGGVSGLTPLVTPDGSLWLFARDPGGAIWATTEAPGDAFQPWQSLGGSIRGPVAAAVDASSSINLVGLGTDGRIWSALQRENDVVFDAFAPMPVGPADGPPALGATIDTAVGVTSTRLLMAYTGAGGTLFAQEQISFGTWIRSQGYDLVSGVSMASPVVTNEPDGRAVTLVLAGGAVLWTRLARPSVTTTSGTFLGRRQALANTFLGLPYAKPPVGSLRWRPPQPPPTSFGWPRDANTSAPPCVQWDGTGSEDCLYLNVFAPAGAVRAPVMVFVHGGSNVNGSAQGFDGAALVNRAAQLGRPVVVVTIQYRLGVLGFLALAGHANGNFGLLDQIAALGWVQSNIASFGGDPRRVLLFGESAGAEDVTFLAGSPATHGRGLFTSVIAESGGRQKWLASLADAQALGAQIAATAGCPPAPDDWPCLLAATPVALNEAAYPQALAVNPVIDGSVVAARHEVALAANLEVPLVIGTNREERAASLRSVSPASPAEYASWVDGTFGVGSMPFNPARPFDATVAPGVLSLYPPQPDSTWQELYAWTDSDFTCAERHDARAAASAGHTVYRYLFTHVAEDPDAYWGPLLLSAYRAYHGSELPYVFASLGLGYRPSAAELSLSDQIVKYWTQLAATGDPNAAGLPPWSPYTTWSSTSDPVLALDDTITTSPGNAVAACNFLDAWY